MLMLTSAYYANRHGGCVELEHTAICIILYYISQSKRGWKLGGGGFKKNGSERANQHIKEVK